MLIDWFTVSAQIVNFLILVWLLKRFLYKPILHAIEEREQRILRQLQEATMKRAEAQRERDDFQHKIEELDRQRHSLMTRAESDVAAERQRLLEQARQEFESLRSRLSEKWLADQASVRRDLTRCIQKEVFAIARRTLADLAAIPLEERIADLFVHRLRELEGEERGRFTAALKTARHPTRVRSAFELPQAQRAAIERAVEETLAAEALLVFETAPEVLGGIELTTDGYKIAWSIAEYLGSLEKSLGDILERTNGADTAAG